MTDTEPKPVVSMAIIARDGAVLMIRRRQKEGELLWAFPGGAVEDGETAEQAAVREVAEEVGLTVESESVLGRRVHPKTGREMVYTACALVAGEPTVLDEEDIAEVAWVKHSEIDEHVPYGLFEPVQAYLDEALAS
ncbi:NUDIX hydrolase [Streptomyces xanthochromogenes]|uniref:NUDIX hydrolase n=1 Tax=Streptomyces xanthochromogenes TaxID=67384 RepID=UPI002F426091